MPIYILAFMLWQALSTNYKKKMIRSGFVVFAFWEQCLMQHSN